MLEVSQAYSGLRHAWVLLHYCFPAYPLRTKKRFMDVNLQFTDSVSVCGFVGDSRCERQSLARREAAYHLSCHHGSWWLQEAGSCSHPAPHYHHPCLHYREGHSTQCQAQGKIELQVKVHGSPSVDFLKLGLVV